MGHSSARSTSPAGQPGDPWRDRRGRATSVVRLCGARRVGHIVGRACAAGYGCKAHIEVRGGPENRQSPRWGLARIHPVRTYLALLGKKVRTGSIETITWTVHIEFRIPATVSNKDEFFKLHPEDRAMYDTTEYPYWEFQSEQHALAKVD